MFPNQMKSCQPDGLWPEEGRQMGTIGPGTSIRIHKDLTGEFKLTFTTGVSST
jgi:hypothetical protein